MPPFSTEQGKSGAGNRQSPACNGPPNKAEARGNLVARAERRTNSEPTSSLDLLVPSFLLQAKQFERDLLPLACSTNIYTPTPLSQEIFLEDDSRVRHRLPACSVLTLSALDSLNGWKLVVQAHLFRCTWRQLGYPFGIGNQRSGLCGTAGCARERST